MDMEFQSVNITAAAETLISQCFPIKPSVIGQEEHVVAHNVKVE